MANPQAQAAEFRHCFSLPLAKWRARATRALADYRAGGGYRALVEFEFCAEQQQMHALREHRARQNLCAAHEHND